MGITFEYGCGCSTVPFDTPTYIGDRPQTITGVIAQASNTIVSVGQWMYEDANGAFEIKTNTDLTGKQPILLMGLFDETTKKIVGSVDVSSAPWKFGQFFKTKGDTKFPCSSTFIKSHTTGQLVPFDATVHTTLASALDISYRAKPGGGMKTECSIK